MSAVRELPREWRERASHLRTWADAEGAARALETAAAELDEALREARDEELTLADAARTSGYSERRIRELVADGSIPNVGRKGRPRVRRGDLPHKAGHARGGAFDAHGEALNIVGGAG